MSLEHKMLDAMDLQFTVLWKKIANSIPSSTASKGEHTSRAPLILELGTGSALKVGNYTKAAIRAVQDGLWRNSINLVELFDV